VAADPEVVSVTGQVAPESVVAVETMFPAGSVRIVRVGDVVIVSPAALGGVVNVSVSVTLQAHVPANGLLGRLVVELLQAATDDARTKGTVRRSRMV
jgi:hypothetical protein